MIETLLTMLKTTPIWLQTALQILVVVLFTTLALSIIAGMWLSFCIIHKRKNMVAKIEFWPPRITFEEKDHGNPQL
jgi:hypothetical protein